VSAVASESPAIPYVICALDDIPSRRAKAFQLLRRTGDGDPPRTFSILIVRWGIQVFGYVNECPHNRVNLDWERNQFLDPSGLRLMCGKHGALFEIGTGRCVDGPCSGKRLEPVAVSVIEGDICVSGVDLVEEEDTGAPTP
jgi:nitrite reductase/ring-hydroxylating ferredoxin subunit